MFKTQPDRRSVDIKKTVLSVLGIVTLAFVGFQVYPIIHGPKLEIKTVSNGQVLTEPLIHISGIAKYTKDLVVNGSPFPIAPDGSFDETFILNPGYNVVTMSAEDRYGNNFHQNFVMVLQENPDKTFTVLDNFVNKN